MAPLDERCVWSQRQKSVVDANRDMFTSKVACDVTFLLAPSPGGSPLQNPGGGCRGVVRVEAHRYVLLSRSPVFHAMFCGPLGAGLSGRQCAGFSDSLGSEFCDPLGAVALTSGEIVVPDLTADAFSEVLRFLYCEEAELTGENVVAVLYGAKKYLIEPLAQLCTAFMERAVCEADVCTILDQSLALGEQRLVDKCLRFMRSSTEAALDSPGFTEVSPSTLALIAQQDELNIEEIKLFERCVTWAQAELMRKSDLDPNSLHDPDVDKPKEELDFKLLKETIDNGRTAAVNIPHREHLKVQMSASLGSAELDDYDPQDKLQLQEEHPISKIFATPLRGNQANKKGASKLLKRLSKSTDALDRRVDYLEILNPCLVLNPSEALQIRRILSGVLPLIRFDTMSPDDVRMRVAPLAILAPGETEAILRRIAEFSDLYGRSRPAKRNRHWLEPPANSNHGLLGRAHHHRKGGKNGGGGGAVVDQRRTIVRAGLTWSVPFQLFW